MDMLIGNPNNWTLLLVVGAAMLTAVYAMVYRRRAARRFATANLLGDLLPARSFRRHWLSAWLVLAVLSLIAIALLDVRWGKTEQDVPQKGIEVIFVLDVSRSMLAEDVSPTRLDRAKQQIMDMVDEMSGDRVGLVVFAGESHQEVPLTTHYGDFKQALDAVGPHSVSRGGSRLGDAIRAASNAFLSKTMDHKAIVVFTDGEDQESEPLEAAQAAFAEKGIRIFTVGLGDMDQGARIRDTESQKFVEHDGQTVWTKLNGRILSQIASETNAAYIPAGTKRVDMVDVYHGYVAGVQQTEFETAKITTYTPRFQWFALPALALLLLEVTLTTRQPRI